MFSVNIFSVCFAFNTDVHFVAVGDFPQKNIYILTELVQCYLQSQVTHINNSQQKFRTCRGFVRETEVICFWFLL